ncbi:NAD-dependent succinate-semialdehyde dehydrogenase [Kocuria sp. JC486]|uniref:NAD-dependent succinate-semialdehyde dehydrogenase n=1 Tax=Kocuria soli TaxID=2485125 RepID=A0A3N3ZRH0_9MICC|nr:MULTISPECIES: NAD-dependent succinate-semialdehyde dehydrogenase [Kocuria]NHU86098.1 NAD-dependent succinate-semialdehyde dehydrogenase [Kocuria sp. JC486]ROZ62153.1 NAD-dependent succinate-semialdehyde dehydrogenase [Kocuria soli]
MSNGTQYKTVNPASGQTTAEYDTVTDEQLEEALVKAEAGFAAWRAMPIEDRAEIVTHVAELFKNRADDLAAIATQEMGKPLAESRGEAEFCADIFGYYADQGPALAADQPIKSTIEGKAVIQSRPIGALLGIMPWNYPFYQVARFAAPNLMLGNVILLKHAESVPQCALAIQDIMREAGVPEGVYQNIFASHDQIERVIGDPRIQGVSLTGSERAGAKVAEIAGRNLKKVVLELGGSDPFVVLDTDNVAESAQLAFDTRIENTGQACNSNKRIIVSGEIYDDFVAEMVRLTSELEPADPAAERPKTYGPMSSRAAAEKLDQQVKTAVEEGATLHVGGELSSGPEAFFSPAVLTDVAEGTQAYKEELFGPVIVVYRVESDEEALALANDTPFGLGGSVHSTDPKRAEAIAQLLEVGMSAVNAPSAETAEMPFGGVKRSGYGRELGPLGMDEFVNKRLLFIAGPEAEAEDAGEHPATAAQA